MSQTQTRLDVKLVELGLAQARQRAVDYIKSSKVRVDGCLIVKPGHRVTSENKISVEETDTYVSRGALKLVGALKDFNIDLSDKICLDIGASTGGFTQVCLEHGAKQVIAVDVGSNQLHPMLRNDPRVISKENTDIRALQVEKPVDFACIDVSFISLSHIMPKLAECVKPSGDAIALIKPQFEVGKELLPKNGVVTDLALHRMVIKKVSALAEAQGFKVKDQRSSCIKGKAGNLEYLMHLQKV